jgi:hypothetical protein
MGLAATVVEARTELTSVPASRGVNNLGYRGWAGNLVPGWMRWWVITEVGVRRAWQSRWLRRMLVCAWLPAVWFGVGFFLWEQAALHTEWKLMLQRMVPPTSDYHWIRSTLQSDNVAATRHAIWAWLLQAFFRYPQGVLMVMVIGVISPPLISQDIRSRAFLLYFSRPLTRVEYLFGKVASLWAYLALISTVPAIALYLLGVLLSPNLGVISATWDLPLRIIGASIVMMVPTSALALCFSSLTQESRYAGFAWFAIWILGWFTYLAAASADSFNEVRSFEAERAYQQSVMMGRPLQVVEVKESPWTHLSLYHTLGRVQRWVFGFSKFDDVFTSTVILAVITMVSLGITYRRISAPMRV